MGSENRQRPRRNTPHHVKVLNLQTLETVGRVVDITADGMKIVTKDDIAIGEVFEFRIVLPVMVHYRTEVDVEAEAMWTRQDENPAYRTTGFRFLDLPGEDGFLLEDVMHKLNLVG